jgi:acyl carrier protein
VEVEKLHDDTHLVNDCGADSLDLVEIVMELEEEFDIEIPDAKAEGAVTVGQAVALVEKEIQAQC